MYNPLPVKQIIENPADAFSRIFLFRGTLKKLFDEKTQYFEADTETSKLPDDKNDSNVVAWSLAPCKGEYSRYGITSDTFTNNNTALSGLFDSLCLMGTKAIYVYFHNLDFDGRFILNWLIKEKGYSQLFDKKMTVTDIPYSKNVLSILYNNGLYEIRFVYNEHLIIVRDSFKLWRESIEKISDEIVKINEKDIQSGRSASFPLAKRKEDLSYDYDKIHNFGEKIELTEMNYILNDSLIGSSILKMFEEFGNLGVSCSGMAYQNAVRSFQQGILSADVVKFVISEKFDEISQNHEFSKFLKTVVHGEKTYIFAKNYYTIDYNELNENSAEYICDIPTQYTTRSKGQKTAITDIEILIEFEHIKIIEKIMNNVKTVSEFNVFNELRKNIVYQAFSAEHTGMSLADKIVKYANLWRLKAKRISGTNNFSEKTFDYYYQSVFVPLSFDDDAEIRNAYRGGLSAAVETYSNVVQHNVFSIDINSSYPYQMENMVLPYGKAEKIEYNVQMSDKLYSEISDSFPCFIMEFQCSYCLQYPYNPMIPEKNSLYGYAKFKNRDTMLDQIAEDRTIFMTNVEFELFRKTHKVDINSVYLMRVWGYKGAKNLFYSYVEKMYEIKKKSKHTSMYAPVKEMLNSIYGRYAMNRFKFSNFDNIIEFDKNGIMKFRKSEREKVDYSVAKGGYLPLAIFITAYARVQLIETANAINLAGGKVYYYDTDSLHMSADNASVQDGFLCINDISICEIDEKKLGAWKIELCKKIEDNGNIIGVDDALFVCSKRYAEADHDTGILNIRCAGVPKSKKKEMSFEDIAIDNIVTVNRKKSTKSGVIINQYQKKFSFNKNIYKTVNGMVISDYYYEVGSHIRDMYDRKSLILSVVYNKPEFEIEFYDSDEMIEKAGGNENE